MTSVVASARRPSRGSQRGGVFTELLAILPALMVINMVLLYLWSAYSAKQYTMTTSRRAAWRPALTGCQTPATIAGATKAAAAPDTALEPLAPRVTTARQHAPTFALKAPFENLTRSASAAESTGRGREVKSAWAELAAADYTTTSAVLCNEVPRSVTSADERRAVVDAWTRYVGR